MKLKLEYPIVRLEKFWLYETKTFLYLVGFDDAETKFRLLKINRSISRPKDLSEIIMEDPLVYNGQEIGEILGMISEGNKQSGGIVKICTAYGIVGFVRFLDGYYLTLITQRKEVGCIDGNYIYSIKATEMFPIRPKEEPENSTFRSLWKKLNKKLNQTTSEIAENRYMGLFQFVDMTKDFFFSYSYDLTKSLQLNYVLSKTDNPSEPLEMFEWNHYQINDLRKVIGKEESLQWTMPIIHGSYQQKRFSIFGRILDLILIARRSRHYAGTRYLKRGLNVHGKVANDCEVEQILQHGGGYETQFTSYVQMRGSIPTYWHQETSVTMPKPPILLNRIDPDYLATQEHFTDLFGRYGSPILVLDLVKQHEKRPRESIVGREFRQAIEVLNESIRYQHKIRYFALDYSKITSISKGKLSKVKTKGGGGSRFLGYGSKGGDKERAMTAVGEEWAMMEKQLGKDQSQTSGKSNSSGPNPPLADTNKMLSFDEAKKDFGGSLPSPNYSLKAAVTGLPAGYDSIAEVNAVESKIDVLRELEEIANLTLFETGFFCSSVQYLDRVSKHLPKETVEVANQQQILFQKGVLRTNCIDCLDRTNGGQFAVAMRFLLISLQALGISSPHLLSLDLSQDPVLLSLMEMYGEMGDKIALQYGGSEAHKKVFAGKSVQAQSSSKQSELLTSIKRYYSNAFTDMVKQDAMNLFLGCFVPSESNIPLWDLESDYYLHNLDLHPHAPPIYQVLYEEIVKDADAVRDPQLRSRLETALKKAIIDWLKHHSSTSNNNSTIKEIENGSNGDHLHRTGSNDSLTNSNTNNISSHTGFGATPTGFELTDAQKLKMKLDISKLLRRYYVRSIEKQVSGEATNNTSGGGKLILKGKSSSGVSNQSIRSLARLERRKFMRKIASRRIAASAEDWWQKPLASYESSLDAFVQQYSAQQPVIIDPSNGNYYRFHQPYRLSEFDNILSNEFLVPQDAVDGSADSERKKHYRASMDLLPEELEAPRSQHGGTTGKAGSGGGGQPTANSKEEEGNTDNTVLPYGLSSLFSFYPSLANTIYGNESNPSNPATTTPSGKTSGVPNGTGGVDPSSDSLQSSNMLLRMSGEDDGKGDNSNLHSSGGFHITKYVREIGIKARTLVGGFLRKDDATTTPSGGSRRIRTISDENALEYRRNSEISLLRHTISKFSMNLYKRYRDCSENHWLLAIEKDNRFVEEEYNTLLKDLRVSADDVSGMEQLAADGYISAQMTRGVFQGLPQTSSALLAYGFLFTSIVNVETELADFGSYVDLKASLSRSAGFSLHANSETSPSMQALRMARTSSMINNEVQERIIKSILRSKIPYGLEMELKKNVNNYIFQQYTYNKEISLDRLARRISPYSVERSILDYCGQFDYDLLASNVDTIDYIASSAAGYTSFKDLLQLKQKLEPIRNTILQRKKQQLQQLESQGQGSRHEKENEEKPSHTKGPIEKKDNDLIVPTEVSSSNVKDTTISTELGLSLDGLLEDLNTNYDAPYAYPSFPYNQGDEIEGGSWTLQMRDKEQQRQRESKASSAETIRQSFEAMEWNDDYAGFIHLGPDLYSKMTNPHLQLNEIGVIRFKEALGVR